MTPPPDRRSQPGAPRSLGWLYPVSLDSDPKELAKQVTEVLTLHARRHEQNQAHFEAFNRRVENIEEQIKELKGGLGQMAENVDKLEGNVLESLVDFKESMAAGFADVKLERTVDRTKIRTTVRTMAVIWSVLTVLGGAAWHYLTRPSCKPDEALIGERCVQVTTVVARTEVK